MTGRTYNAPVNDTSTQDKPDRPQLEASAGPQPAEPPTKVPVAWIAGNETLRALSRTLEPVAIGLIDELVELLVICPQAADCSGLPAPPVEVVRYGRLRRWPFRGRTIDWLAGEIKSRKVQLLHALDASGVHLTRELARRTDLPYLISSYALGDARRLGGLDDHLLAAVLAASQAIRSEFLAGRGASAEKIRLVRPGVYQVQRPTCFSEPDRSVAIIAGGNMDHFGAFEAVLRTFVELRRRQYDCVFFLIGKGRAEKRLREQAKQLRLRQEVTFVDRQPGRQMPGIFKAADVFISPTSSREVDTWALLAMAAGVPVLAAADGVCDFLIDQRTAVCFKQGNSAELTAKLTALLDDRDAARRLAADALAYTREHHSPADMVAALRDIYRQAVA